MASRRMLGGAMLASLYTAGRGVALRVPVINRQALSSASTFVAWHDKNLLRFKNTSQV